jgi:hypothetical protein
MTHARPCHRPRIGTVEALTRLDVGHAGSNSGSYLCLRYDPRGCGVPEIVKTGTENETATEYRYGESEQEVVNG